MKNKRLMVKLVRIVNPIDRKEVKELRTQVLLHSVETLTDQKIQYEIDARFEIFKQRVREAYVKEVADEKIERFERLIKKYRFTYPKQVYHILAMATPTVSEIDVDKVSSLAYFFIASLKRRVLKKDKNVIMAIDGGTGSGKSFSAIALARALDPLFEIDRNIVFTAKEFIERQKTARKGEVIIWDETGVEFGARDFATKLNKAISKVFQTMRFKNTFVILTVPRLSMIDKHARELIHYHIHTNRILYSYNLALLDIYMTKYLPVFNDTRLIHPTLSLFGEQFKISRIAVTKIPSELEKEYRMVKNQFFADLISKQLKDEEMEDEEEKSKVPLATRKAKMILEEMHNPKALSKYVKITKDGKVHVAEGKIAVDYGVSFATAHKVAKIIKDEGFINKVMGLA